MFWFSSPPKLGNHFTKPKVISKRVCQLSYLSTTLLEADSNRNSSYLSNYYFLFDSVRCQLLSTLEAQPSVTFYLQVLKALEDWRSTERLPFMCQPPRLVSWTYGSFWETQASRAELWSIMGNGSSCDQQGRPPHPSDPVHSLWHSCITSRGPGRFQGYICNLTLYVILPTPLAVRMFPQIK